MIGSREAGRHWLLQHPASGMRVASSSLRFTAGSPKVFDTLNLKEAKALLNELAV
jgi:hypothetical protein